MGVGILTGAWLNVSVLDFSLVTKRVSSKGKALTVVMQKKTLFWLSPFLESLDDVLKRVPFGIPFLPILLCDFNARVDNDGVIWSGVIGMNGLPDLNPNNVLFLDFCARHRLSIINTIFDHRVGYNCTWYQDTY